MKSLTKKSASKTSCAVIFRVGVGQVRQTFGPSGKLIAEELVTTPVDPKRPARIVLARHRKVQEWVKCFPPAGEILWPAPQWVWNALAEIERMYFPELWQRFTTAENYGKDIEQSGLHCGYLLAQGAYALDHAEELGKRDSRILEAALGHQASVLPTMNFACTKLSLPQARKFFAAFNRALGEDPFDVTTGKPHAETDRYIVLRLLIDEWNWVESEFAQTHKLLKELGGAVNERLLAAGKPGCKPDRFKAICQTIGLALR
jgi:hypothetical protein